MDEIYAKLENTLASQKEDIASKLHALETVITHQKTEIVSEINEKVEKNSQDIMQILEENKILKKENTHLQTTISGLKDQLAKIETFQLSNNDGNRDSRAALEELREYQAKDT